MFKPDALLKQHRALARRKWMLEQRRAVGRPATNAELRALVIRLAQENSWDYDKIKGELQKLGICWTEPR